MVPADDQQCLFISHSHDPTYAAVYEQCCLSDAFKIGAQMSILINSDEIGYQQIRAVQKSLAGEPTGLLVELIGREAVFYAIYLLDQALVDLRSVLFHYHSADLSRGCCNLRQAEDARLFCPGLIQDLMMLGKQTGEDAGDGRGGAIGDCLGREE